jgi:hypothetical protein
LLLFKVPDKSVDLQKVFEDYESESHSQLVSEIEKQDDQRLQVSGLCIECSFRCRLRAKAWIESLIAWHSFIPQTSSQLSK